MTDPKKFYLFVRVVNVTDVCLPDQRPVELCDSFLEISFNGVSKRTHVVQDTVNPVFNVEMSFCLELDQGQEGFYDIRDFG